MEIRGRKFRQQDSPVLLRELFWSDRKTVFVDRLLPSQSLPQSEVQVNPSGSFDSAVVQHQNLVVAQGQ